MHLLVLPGDGIGPEITEATVTVLKAVARRHGLDVTLDEAEIGLAALARTGTTLPEGVTARALAADGVILGPVSHNSYPPREAGGINPSGALRKALGLYANIRPARGHAALPRPVAAPVDMVIVRENLEGFYADRNMHVGPGEFMPEPGIALAMRKITAEGSRRIARAAFRIAAERPARRLTAVHKANVLRLSDGLFLSEMRAEAANWPDIAYDEQLVDAMAALMVRDPARFDVIAATNMFGDILSDLAAELSGGLGLGASLNLGERHAVAQAQHGSAPDIAGQDRANPSALIGSLAMLLRHLGASEAAAGIDRALEAMLASPATRTPDLGGPLGTRAFASRLSGLIDGG